MAAKLVIVDRHSAMLLPPDLRDWLPEDHMVHFIVDAVDLLDLRGFQLNERGSGSAQYPPRMMLALLIYCYATGRFSSRAIEAATHFDVAVRYLCGGDNHPDHSVICAFRTANAELFKECFVRVLAMAQQMGTIKKVGTVSVDGTKVKANASKHAAVSYKRADEMIGLLEGEVEALTAKAESADAKPLDDGFSLPDEITRRQDRIKQLKAARDLIEKKFEPKRQEQELEYKRKAADRERREQAGETIRGPKLKPPPNKPDDKAQVNFTDSDSGVMKAGNGKHFEQAYNAQAAVDADGTHLIFGERVSTNPNDKNELAATLNAIPSELGSPEDILADAGYYNQSEIEAVEKEFQATCYVPPSKIKHSMRVKDLEKQEDPKAPDDGAPFPERMRHRLQTKEGKQKYAVRKHTVEPVFGIVKAVMGFRQFSLRGHPKVRTEWTLVCLAYNLKRLHQLAGRNLLPGNQEIASISA